jgi:hypothetical protein
LKQTKINEFFSGLGMERVKSSRGIFMLISRSIGRIVGEVGEYLSGGGEDCGTGS